MSNPTTPFGWQMPTATDLVTDLPADFEVFGQAVATSMADLLGGTSGQVLAKNSNTDMDFVWVTSDDANAIQNAIVDAKGDLIAASAADTPARLAVGNNGETLVADSSTSTGLRYQSNFAAGKNKIINGDMVIAQRGTSVAGITTDNTYNTVDRFLMRCVTIGTYTQSQETDAPAGFSKSLKVLCTTADASPAAADRLAIVQKLEGDSVQDFAYGTASARTITLSFWVKSNVTGTFIAELFNAKSGTPKQVSNSYTISVANTWERKTIVIAGDTATAITAANTEQFTLIFWLAAGSNFTSGTLQTAWAAEVAANRAVGQTNLAAAVNNSWQVTGVQIEISNTATAFQTSTGTIQGELAACQRYYYRNTAGLAYAIFSTGFCTGTTAASFGVQFPVPMRTAPASIDTTGTAANYAILSSTGGVTACSAVPVYDSNTSVNVGILVGAVAAGLVAGNGTQLRANNAVSAYIGWSAEL